MHEYSIIAALVDQVDATPRPPGAVVKKVHVRIGELAGVETVLLATAFDTFKERTVCAAADLLIDAVAATWSCPRCRRAIPRGTRLRCDACACAARLSAGDEIVLARIEMEVP